MEEAQRLERLAQLVLGLDAEATARAVEDCLRASVAPMRVLTQGLSAGMRLVGEKFKNGEIYMPEVLVACDVYYRSLALIRPYITTSDLQAGRGKVILGTIHGDIHTVGKDVAIPVFQAAGYEVVDLGINVPDGRFVEAIREHRPHIVGLGTYMTSTFMHTGETVRKITEAGLRSQVKIICGGPAVDAAAARRMGADDASDDAWEAVEKMDRLMGES